MAKIKISQSESTVTPGKVAQTGALALPMSLATTIGSGWSAIGKVIDDIHKDQVAVEDQNDLLDIVKKVAVDIEGISSSASKNSDVKFAVDTFDTLTKPEVWSKLLTNKRPRVKKLFGEWLSKTKTSEYTSIARTVAQNHIKRTKQTNNDHLDGLTLKMSSSNIEKASNARTDMDSWFNNVVNSSVYTEEEFKELQKEKELQAEKYIISFGAKNNPDYTIENYPEIKKQLEKERGKTGTKLAEEALEIAKQTVAANVDFDIKQERWVEKRKQDDKIGTFTELLLRIKNDDDPEYLGKIPTLDLLNDLSKAGKINTAQYEALLKFYNKPEDYGSEDVLRLINSQIYIADSVEELDQIHRTLNLTPEYLMELGIKDVGTINGVLEKAKNREIFQDMKHYKNVLDDLLGKLDNGIFVSLSSSTDVASDKKLRTKAERLYNEYLDDGLNPEEAFKRVSKGYLLQQNRMPTIYDVAEITSIPTLEPSDTQKKADPNEIFNNWRKEVALKYKDNSINIDEYKRDLDSLDIMQDIFKIRQTYQKIDKDFDAWGASNATTGGAVTGK
jgi:hypothetical protein